MLFKLTSAFPVFVLAAALTGVYVPSALLWVNRRNGNVISSMLAAVMIGMGMTLQTKDFAQVVVGKRRNVASVPAGVLCQFIIMPLASFLVGKTLLLSYSPTLFLGLILVGCSPGGTASNLVSLIAGADVALSVLLTASSTILASIVTPLLIKLMLGRGTTSIVSVSGLALCAATARVVLLPVLLGMAFNNNEGLLPPQFCTNVSRFTPLTSVVLVALICGGVMAQHSSTLLLGKGALPRILLSVVTMHTLGFFAGFVIPRYILGFSERTSRTISIETGMQNSALAVVLAHSIITIGSSNGGGNLATLPGALSATVHSCLGSILAVWWRIKDATTKSKKKESFIKKENTFNL